MAKARYSLIQPTQLLIEKCFRLIQANLLTDKEMKGNLMEQFNSQHFGVEMNTHVQHCLQVSQTVPEVLTCTSAMVQKSIPTLISNCTTNCIAYKLVSQIVPASTSTESITISIPGIPNIIYYRGGKGHLIVLVVVIPSVHTYIFMMCPVLCSCTTVCHGTVEYNPNVYHTD